MRKTKENIAMCNSGSRFYQTVYDLLLFGLLVCQSLVFSSAINFSSLSDAPSATSTAAL